MSEKQAATSALVFDRDRGGVQLTNTDDMLAWARILLREGMCPTHFKTPAQVVIALQAGTDAGLSLTASLQNVCVIERKPAIYGDGAKALVLNSGKVAAWEEWWELDGVPIEDPAGDEWPDSLTAVTRLKRHGGGTVTRRFSVGDAKRANLWMKRGKNGYPTPWVTFPLRMLRVRSMGWAMRDLFADALCGLAIKEEIQDIRPEPPREAEYTTLEALGLKSGQPQPPAEPEPEEAAEAEAEGAEAEATSWVEDLRAQGKDEGPF